MLTHVYMLHVHDLRKSESTSGVDVIFYSLLLGQGSLLNLKLTDWLDWLGNSSCLLDSASLVPGLQPHVAMPGFLTLVWRTALKTLTLAQ